MSTNDPQGATISIVIPTLGDSDRLRISLSAALSAIDARGFDPDEILVVDDSGSDRAATVVPEILGSLESRRKSSVHVLKTSANSGFGAAVKAGAEKARGSLLFILQDDTEIVGDALVQMGQLMQREATLFAVSPTIYRATPEGSADGTPGGVADGSDADADARTEQVRQELRLVDDRLEVRETQVAIDKDRAPAKHGEVRASRVSFGPATALMVRRPKFLELGGFDPLFAPFTWEDVDLGIAAGRHGLHVFHLETAAVKHHAHLPSVWDAVDTDLGRAVVERNRLLLRWKHLATRAEATDHLVSLWRCVIEAGLSDDREMLENVCLAFERLGEVTKSRASMQGATRDLGDALLV